jgi:hypothetical protein
MMLYSNLPVFKVAYDLNVRLFEIVKKFDREYKYTLGERLKKISLKLIINIYRTNRDIEHKLKHISKARVNIEKIRLLIRIAKDLRILSLKAFVSLQEKIESISKQLSSWHKYESKNTRV